MKIMREEVGLAFDIINACDYHMVSFYVYYSSVTMSRSESYEDQFVENLVLVSKI